MVKRALSKFEEGTVLEELEAGAPKGCAATQRDFARLKNWDDRYLKKFKGKHKVLYPGKKTSCTSMCRGSTVWKATLQKRLLEFCCVSNWEGDTSVCGSQRPLVKKSIGSRSRQVIFLFYPALEIQSLGCCGLIWAPRCNSDMDTLQGVQQWVAKVIMDLEHMRHERLTALGLSSLNLKRPRVNLTNINTWWQVAKTESDSS